jgi:hypothetical protein
LLLLCCCPWLRPRNEESPAAASPLSSKGEALPWAPLPGAESFGSAVAEIPQAFHCCRFSVAPSPQRGNPRCSLRIGEGPALQIQSANARLLVDRHFLGGLNLIQMLLPHNELPVMVGGVGGITPLDIPPIPPSYSQRGVMPATRKAPQQLLLSRKSVKPFPGLPYQGPRVSGPLPQKSRRPFAAAASPWLCPRNVQPPNRRGSNPSNVRRRFPFASAPLRCQSPLPGFPKP